MWEFVERLQRVVLENRPAFEVMLAHDSTDALHYVDPPYVHHTRPGLRHGRKYRYEMSDDEHAMLAEFLDELQGHVVLSGYPSELYREMYRDWDYFEKHSRDAANSVRTEGLWVRPDPSTPVHPPPYGQFKLFTKSPRLTCT